MAVAALLLGPVLALLGAVPSEAAADALFQKHLWAKAEAAYQERTVAAPDDALSWLRLGICRVELGKGNDAMPPLETAQKLGVQANLVQYELAQAAALSRDKGRVLSILQSLVDEDFYPVGVPAAQEKAFAALAKDPAFTKLSAAMELNRLPCNQANPSSDYRALDFWVGDWDVVDKGGNPVGTSHVERILSGCALLETWKGQGVGEGRSLSAWNAGLRHWEQYWVDVAGLPIFYDGNFEDGELRLRAESARRNGARLFRRQTFSKVPNGRVRQLSETSTDGGRTWQTDFDFLYLKRAAAR